MFTSVINNKINEQCNMNQILPEEQEGCIQKSLGCKQQLTINAIIPKQAHEEKHKILISYVNQKKSILLGIP
jgi:SUMO ligase MMS21 Smc5/6 complex component